MAEPLFLAAIDLGTTALKACVYEIGDRLILRASSARRITLDSGNDGRAEQDPEEWWDALVSVLPEVIRASGLGPASIAGISFCAQMQCLVLVDAEGRAVRPALSYLDSRASVRRARLTAGGPRVAGIGLGLLIPWMRIAGGVAASAKDPLWKYLRVMDEEPEAFSRVHRWLDAKDFLIARCTGRFIMSNDSAYATFLADTRRDKTAWSPNLIRRFGVCPAHLPDILAPSAVAGPLLPSAARSLGVSAGTPVFAGAGDASLIGIGAGAAAPGSTHIYMGTSGWVSTVVERRIVDPFAMMAAVPGPVPGRYAYFGEQETSGKCLEWVRDHLALDEIGVYLEKRVLPAGPEEEYKSLIDYLTASIAEIPAGSGGLIFTPWLHGSRSPFEDPRVRGMFFNIGLETGKRQMIRAVVEGLAYNARMLLEAQEHRARTSKVIRFAGGGALSDETCRIFADVTDHIVEPVIEPQNAGAAGAALAAAWGMGRFADLDAAASTVPVRDRFEPRAASRSAHDRNYRVFRELYPATKRLFARLNPDSRQ
jgi:xylulokinase